MEKALVLWRILSAGQLVPVKPKVGRFFGLPEFLVLMMITRALDILEKKDAALSKKGWRFSPLLGRL